MSQPKEIPEEDQLIKQEESEDSNLAPEASTIAGPDEGKSAKDAKPEGEERAGMDEEGQDEEPHKEEESENPPIPKEVAKPRPVNPPLPLGKTLPPDLAKSLLDQSLVTPAGGKKGQSSLFTPGVKNPDGDSKAKGISPKPPPILTNSPSNPPAERRPKNNPPSIPMSDTDYMNRTLAAMMDMMKDNNENINRNIARLNERIDDIMETRSTSSRGSNRRGPQPPIPMVGGPPPTHAPNERLTNQIDDLIHQANTSSSTNRPIISDHRQNLLPPRPLPPTRNLNPYANTFSPDGLSHSQGFNQTNRSTPGRPNEQDRLVNQSIRSSIGYSNHDDRRATTRTRQRRTVEEPIEETNYMKRMSEQVYHFSPDGTERPPMSIQVSNTLRRLSPIPTLQVAIKGRKILSRSLATFGPWKDYWDGILRSCYLECVAFMDPRWAPDTREEWVALDEQTTSESIRARTYSCLTTHEQIPIVSRDDEFDVLNGVFHGVMDAFPQLLPILTLTMSESIDKIQLSHITDRETSDRITLRMMYFKSRSIFLDPLMDARTKALADFNATKYDRNIPPLEFLDKVLIKARAVDVLHDFRQVSDGAIWGVTINGIKDETGDLYGFVVDHFRDRQGYIEQTQDTLRTIVTMIDNKWRERKKSNHSQYGMHIDTAGTEEAHYASSHRSKHDRTDRSHGSGRKGDKGERKQASELPCFNFQRNGTCKFDSCKFSHDPEVLARAPPPPPTASNMAAMADSIVDMHAALAAQKAKFRSQKARLKSTIRGLKKGKKPEYPTGQNYQDTVNAHAALAGGGQDPSATPVDPIDLKEASEGSDESTTTSSSDSTSNE